MPGVPGRYHVEVFDRTDTRYILHQCDGTYDTINDAVRAVQTAITDENVKTVCVVDTDA